MSKTTHMLAKVKRAFGSLLITFIVLGVPLISYVNLGHFFFNGDQRSAEPLAALNVRHIDSSQAPARLFEEPLISVNFDDGQESIYSTAMPLLQQYGIITTQYLLSGMADDPAYVSWDQIDQMNIAGHEIACHSKDHPNLTILELTTLDEQLKHCKDELGKRYGNIVSFASPYGSSTKQTLAKIGQYYESHRNTAGDPTDGVDGKDVNLKTNFDRMNIIGYTVRSTTTTKQLEEMVAFTKQHNGWLVLTYHQADDDTSEYSITTQDFKKQFAYLRDTNVRIVTMEAALKSAPRN